MQRTHDVSSWCYCPKEDDDVFFLSLSLHLSFSLSHSWTVNLCCSLLNTTARSEHDETSRYRTGISSRHLCVTYASLKNIECSEIWSFCLLFLFT